MAPHEKATYEHVSDGTAFLPMACGPCGLNASVAVLVRDIARETLWLRCPNCNRGAVSNADRGIEPGLRPGSDLRGLPGDVARAYTKARDAASVNAWTATEMMCREILMHVAVDKGAKKGETLPSTPATWRRRATSLSS